MPVSLSRAEPRRSTTAGTDAIIDASLAGLPLSKRMVVLLDLSLRRIVVCFIGCDRQSGRSDDDNNNKYISTPISDIPY